MKKSVMNAIVATLSNQPSELTVEQILSAVRAELDKAETRKNEAHKARAELVANVAPLLRSVMSSGEPMTAMEVFNATKDALPEDFTARKVQAMLVNEMLNEVTIDRTQKKNTYALKI